MLRILSNPCLIVGSAFLCLKQRANCTGENNRSVFSSSETLIHPTISSQPGKPGTFGIVYDNRTRNPKYVIESLKGSGVVCADDEEALLKKKKRKPFYSESSIEVEAFRVWSRIDYNCTMHLFLLLSFYCAIQSNTKDYNNARYDRGHMAPAADFICDPDWRDATFTMANVCPQVDSQYSSVITIINFTLFNYSSGVRAEQRLLGEVRSLPSLPAEPRPLWRELD